MNKKVFIAAELPDIAEQILLQAGLNIVKAENGFAFREEITDQIKDSHAMICLLSQKIDQEIIDQAKELKIIANYAVGFNNIDIEAARNAGIAVTNTPGVLTETTADLAFSLLLASARRVVEGDRMTRAGEFKGWASKLLLGNDIFGKTLGVIGLGRIGSAVAKRAAGFDMKVIYTARSKKDFPGAQKVELATLMKESDFIIVSVPLNSSTSDMINAQMLDLVKPSAHLINIARGEVLDEQHLIKMLKSRKIRGAALDVYRNEPELNKEFLDIPNIILTPHIGSASIETRDKMASICANEVVRAVNNEELKFRVN